MRKNRGVKGPLEGRRNGFDGKKSLEVLDQLIENNVRTGATGLPAFRDLVEARGRKAEQTSKLSINKSLSLLKEAARRHECVTYGTLLQRLASSGLRRGTK